ncbi:MAG: hypothetical protein JWM98_1970 [Thermoleophilia bacterium]|nr:hypothetical protein [Thermoleophilia bacterium]
MRSLLGIVTVAVTAAAMGTASAATSSTVVSATVPAATSLDSTGCARPLNYSQAVLADSPIDYYHLGELSGATALDAGSGNHPGAISGGYTQGQVGGIQGWSDTSTAFTGATGTVSVPGTGVNTANGTYNTVEFWMYENTAADNQVPFSFYQYSIWNDGSGNFGFNSNNSDLYGITGPSVTAMQSRWVHVVAVMKNGDYTGNQLWIDGVSQTLAQRTGVGIPAQEVATPGYVISGHGVDSLYRWNGRIDEVAVYAGILPAARIREHFATGTGAPSPSIDFGAVLAGTSSVTSSDCTLTWGSSNETSMLRVYQQDGSGTALGGPGSVNDWAAGISDWTTGASMFGACLRAVTGAGVTGTWVPNATCPASNSPSWNAIPTTGASPGSKIAASPTAGITGATARLRFGFRAAANQAPGSYAAPVTFEVIGPDA